MEDKQQKLRLWLDDLQSRSWQLELVVSGLSIALLLQLRTPLIQLADNILIYSSDQLILQGVMNVVGLLAGHAWLFVTINLIILVILRGMWVGAIGLRTLSDRIHYESLGYTESFTQYLKNKVPTYDRYVEKMDEILSIIFSFTFLAILMILSICLGLLALYTGMQLIIWLTGWVGIPLLETVPKRIWQILFLSCAALYALDFITLGWVKKRKSWFGWYHPVYRFFSWVTLSALYRPLYYNLISTRLGRTAAYLILPYIIVLNMIGYVRFFETPYFYYGSSPHSLVNSFYDDERKQAGTATTISIPSKIVGGPFLEVFIRYEPKQDDAVLERICPEMSTGQSAEARLACLQQLPQVMIDDSLYQDIRYKFYRHPGTGDKGLLSMIDVSALGRGEHLLRVSKQVYLATSEADTIAWIQQGVIPFWKE